MSETAIHVADTGGAIAAPPKRAPTLGTLRHGARLRLLPVGKLPDCMKALTRAARKYRNDLEHLVVERHGQIDAAAAHEIALAHEAFLHQAIGRWLLREKLTTMQPADVLNCSLSMLKAAELRNKAIARLKLEPLPNDPLSQYERLMATRRAELDAKRLSQSLSQDQ